MSKSKPKIVRCVVCQCLVVVTSIVESYAQPVCEVCDREMVTRDQELWEKDQAEEYERLWKRL